MNARESFLDIVERNRQGEPLGVYSVCSAHPAVIEASLKQAMADDSMVLIESTSNQVNQDGGYTGMTPRDFVSYVTRIADTVGFPAERIMFGGDHLGPNPWSGREAGEAMAHARTLVQQYAEAGFQKIHLDASMFLADDAGERSKPLPDEVVAARAADLCAVVEQTWKSSHPGSPPPVYIIGTEVPVPGGAQEAEEHVEVTATTDALRTIEITREQFHQSGLDDAWSRVCGLVVQPGVEFGDDQVFDYEPRAAAELSAAIAGFPGMVYEAHSTDYQTEEGLANLVRDHFCILKVGPWLTFAYREALFALEAIEREVAQLHSGSAQLSGLSDTLDAVMQADSQFWKKYYPGNAELQSFKRKYSYSDRSRYYWPSTQLQDACSRLFANLRSWGIPLSALSQHMPPQYLHVREGLVALDPEDLALARIRDVIAIYARACGMTRAEVTS